MLKNKIVTACEIAIRVDNKGPMCVAHRDDTHQCNLGANCGGRQRPRIVVEYFTCAINDRTHVVETKKRVRSLRLRMLLFLNIISCDPTRPSASSAPARLGQCPP